MSKNSVGFSIAPTILIFLTSCGGAEFQVPYRTNPKLRGSLAQDQLAICCAKWNDVPFPFDVDARPDRKIVAANSKDGLGCNFSFLTKMPISEVIVFYTKEFEREGWQQKTVLDFDTEYLFVYSKPSKSAVITLSFQDSGSSRVQIFVSAKKEGHESVPL